MRSDSWRGALSPLATAAICIVLWIALNETKHVLGRVPALVISLAIFVAAIIAILRRR